MYECKECKKAPKNGQWKRNYKWKTERGYKNHSCYVDELKRIEKRENEKRRKLDLFNKWVELGVSDHKIGDSVFYVGYTVTHPTHEFRGNRRIHVRYEEKRSYWNSEGVITKIEPPSFYKESDLINAIGDRAKFPCFYYIGNIRPLEICETKKRAYEISRELDAAYKKHCDESISYR